MADHTVRTPLEAASIYARMDVVRLLLDLEVLHRDPDAATDRGDVGNPARVLDRIGAIVG